MKTVETKIWLPVFLLLSAWVLFGVFTDLSINTVEQVRYSEWLTGIFSDFKQKNQLPEISIQVFLQDNPKEIWEVSNKNGKLKSENLIRILALIKEAGVFNRPAASGQDTVVVNVKVGDETFYTTVAKEIATQDIKILTLMKLMEQNNQNRQMRRKQKRKELNG